MSWLVYGRASGLVLLLALLARGVCAQLPPAVSLSFRGPRSCADAPTLADDVARILGTSTESLEPMRVRARARERGVDAYELTLTVDVAARTYERAVTLRSCAEVREAAALLIATAVRPDLGLALSEPDEPTVEAAPAPLPHAAIPVAWWARAALVLDGRALPGVSAGPSLGLGLARGRVRAWAEARYLVPRSQGVPASTFEATIDLFTAALGGALLFDVGPVRIGPSLELEAGGLRGRGRGEEAPRRRVLPWLAVLIGAEAELPVAARYALALGVAAGVPLARPAFQLEGEPAFYETRPVTARVTLAARLRLGSVK